ncbi:Outer membrane protein transport protein (OMPP1/FadL/TodX) [Novipirellula aureliae]|uniref:Outer membrane protein transport protein (OMPP1/FadL/TodX) n=1 Tax=Novipirellula aureliae TaxID=2527966 RepID=A0A5C6DEB1_9BACT|nr:outer membrane protein transport protein [Novipirellula aureliae]TWU34535.1 Outer membrane protein transport protein (OMPP1/FadL/TodX) [Novipirellula aureliae]
MKILRVALILFAASAFAFEANAQTFGIELHNTMMPASGGMAGASLSRPQDLQSAIYGNPATLTQFRGTQFSFGAGWAEPTINIDQSTSLPLVGVDPYAAKSGTPGSAIPNIGVTQDMRVFDLPVTIGLGLLTNAGLGAEYRGVPASNGTSSQYLALDVVAGAGVDLTDRLSVGAAMTVGTSFLDGPFVDLTGMTAAFALRGTIGANYDLGHNTSLGAYWQTKKSFNFEDAVLYNGGTAQDLAFDHPENFGIGVANSSLLDGRLLLAMDIVYKHHSNADFLKEIYNNQWVYQFGAQYAVSPRLRLRAGYAYNENPMRQDPSVTSIGGVDLPDGIPALRYVQGQFAAISQHRITGGVGIRDMLPGVDVDLFAGGMFENTDQFADTISSLESYWVGGAITWRFRRGSGQCLPIPCEWN